MTLDDGWLCPTCKSINRPSASTCYSCHQRRGGETPSAGDAPRPPAMAATAVPPPRPVVPPRTPSPGALSWATAAAGAPRLQRRRLALFGAALVLATMSAALLVAFALSQGWFFGLPPGTVPGLGPSHDLTGSLHLVQASGADGPTFAIAPDNGTGNCEGVGAYADLRAGARIRVTDGTSRIIGIGTIMQGKIDRNLDAGTVCHFAFAVDALPLVDRYEILEGTRSRKAFTRAEFTASGWHVDLQVGP